MYAWSVRPRIQLVIGYVWDPCNCHPLCQTLGLAFSITLFELRLPNTSFRVPSQAIYVTLHPRSRGTLECGLWSYSLLVLCFRWCHRWDVWCSGCVWWGRWRGIHIAHSTCTQLNCCTDSAARYGAWRGERGESRRGRGRWGGRDGSRLWRDSAYWRELQQPSTVSCCILLLCFYSLTLTSLGVGLQRTS